MLTRILATAALVMGALLATATAASAEPADDPYGFNAVRDRTDYFVAPPLDPGALIGANTHKPIILSPYAPRGRSSAAVTGTTSRSTSAFSTTRTMSRTSFDRSPNPIRPVYVYF